jgi:S-formylglutathione hydrolase FrmB
MMRRISFGLMAGVLAVLALAHLGCGRRFDPVASTVSGDQGQIKVFTHDYGPAGSALLPASGDGLTLTESPLRTSRTYVPPGYRDKGEGPPYPVLFLLLDFGGNGLPTAVVDDDYYLEIGLKEIADSMINAGVIQPMIIATIDLYNAYGGSWYTSNSIQGFYEAAFGDFVQYTDTALNAISSQLGRDGRAVSGVGMGGYGAIMLAMKHPDYFASASSINGQLAFAQTSTKYNFHGVADWAPKVFDENFVTPMPMNYFITNPNAVLPYFSMTPDIKLPLRKPYTNLVFSMAAAFSPFNPATATYSDSLTWMNPVMAGGSAQNWKVSLPFLFTGEIWPDVYAKWLVHDATKFLLDNPVQLNNIQVLIEAGTSSEFNILEQNRIFHDAAIARGISTLRYEEFDGYDGYPTTRRHLLGERLREILKFHSDNLRGAS